MPQKQTMLEKWNLSSILHFKKGFFLSLKGYSFLKKWKIDKFFEFDNLKTIECSKKNNKKKVQIFLLLFFYC